MHHYLYTMSVNEGTDQELFYLGVRSCVGDPADDVDYISSSELVHHLISQGLVFEKNIIKEYETREEAYNDEQEYIAQCIENIACINLHCNDKPYSYDLTIAKLDYIKQLYPDVMPNTRWQKIIPGINAIDLKYCVASYSSLLKFIGHPDHLKYFYKTKGTKTYWPGRPDRLMTKTRTQTKYYRTAVETVTGSPQEKIYELLTNHFVDGQYYVILETVIELYKSIKEDKNIYDLIMKSVNTDPRKYSHLLKRL